MNRSAIQRVTLALLLPLLAAGAKAALDELVGPNPWFVLTFVAVLLVAWTGGTGAGILAAIATVALDVAAAVATPSPVPVPIDPLLVPLDALTAGLAVMLGAAVRVFEGRADASARMRDAAAGEAAEAVRRARVLEAVVTGLGREPSVLQVADLVGRQVAALLGDGADVSIRLVDANRHLVPADVTAGRSPGDTAVPLDPFVAEVLDRGAVRHDGPRVVTPLLAGDRPVGLIDAHIAVPRSTDGSRAAQTTPDPVRDAILLAIGRLAGAAIERRGLLGERRRSDDVATAAVGRVERLTGLSAALAGATSSVAIARAVVDEAAEALGASVGLFYAVDPAVGSLELVHARGYPPGLARSHATLAADAPLPAAVAARERRTVEIAGTSGWRQTTRGATDVLAITGTRSLIARPVGSHDGTVSGVLVIQRTTEDALAADEREFLDAVTDQAAQALDRARLYEALDDRDRRLSLTLAASRTGTWELDLASGRVMLSPELRRIHGLGVDTTVEGVDGLASLVSDRDSGRFRSALRRASETGRPFELDYAVVRPDGTAAWAHVAGRGFADEPADEQTRPARPGDPSARPPVRRVMGVVRETTDQVLAEAERDQLLEHEREARRLQEAFIGIISHELRTPITTVLAGSKLLLRQPGLQEQGRDLVSDIESEADRLYRLVEDLLVLSRLERGNLEVGQEPVHIGHVANRVVASERVRWPATRFELVYEGRHRVVRGEETYVEQVVRNLVANAAKYSPPGSTVTVRVASDDGSASVTVLDEGPGILGDEADELFTLFYRSPRTAASASGAGIGLFVCQRLVGAMGGRIWATRRPTGGSEFGFALELFEEDEFDLEPPAEAAAGRRLW